MLHSIEVVNWWSRDGNHKFTTCEWNALWSPAYFFHEVVNSGCTKVARVHEFLNTSSRVEWNAIHEIVVQWNAALFLDMQFVASGSGVNVLLFGLWCYFSFSEADFCTFDLWTFRTSAQHLLYIIHHLLTYVHKATRSHTNPAGPAQIPVPVIRPPDEEVLVSIWSQS